LKYLVFILLCLSLSARAGDIELKVSLEKGDRYTIGMDMVQKITQSIQGMEQVIDQKIGFDIAHEVTEVKSDGNYVVNATYTRTRFAMKAPMAGMNVDYDSETHEGEVPAQAKGFAAMVGGELAFVLSPGNEILDVMGGEAFINRIIESLGLEDGPQKDQVKAAMDQQFGGDGMKEMMRNASIAFPTEAVGVGDTWTSQTDLSAGPAPMTLDNVHELVSVEDGAARIKVTSSAEPKETKVVNNGMEMTSKLGGSQTGYSLVDQATGITTKAEIDQTFEGTMSMMGMEIPMKIESKIDVNGKIL